MVSTEALLKGFRNFMWGLPDAGGLKNVKEVRVNPRIYNRLVADAGNYCSKGYPRYYKHAYELLFNYGEVDVPLVRDETVQAWEMIKKEKELVKVDTNVTSIKLGGVVLGDEGGVTGWIRWGAGTVPASPYTLHKKEIPYLIIEATSLADGIRMDTLKTLMWDRVVPFEVKSADYPWISYVGEAVIMGYSPTNKHRMTLSANHIKEVVDEAKRPKMDVIAIYTFEEAEAIAEWLERYPAPMGACGTAPDNYGKFITGKEKLKKAIHAVKGGGESK